MRFVGRGEETSELYTWLGSDTQRRWVLAGDGGKGKSAIAYHFATELANDNPTGLDAIIWISAKKRRFIEGRTIDVNRPDFTDIGGASRLICGAFGDTSFEDDDHAFKLAKDWLTAFRTLLIVDDIDTLDGESPETIALIHDEFGTIGSVKLLVTSRRSSLESRARSTTVEGLSEADLPAFLRSRCELMKRESGEVLRHASRIATATDRSPLYIEDLLRLTLTGMSVPEAVGHWEGRRGDAARRYAIKREYEKLGQDTQEVLLALSLLEDNPTRLTLRTVLDWSEDRLDDALQPLLDMFLMRLASGGDGVPRLILNTNTRRLVKSEFADTATFVKVERTVAAVSGRLRSSVSENAEVEACLRKVRSQFKRYRYAAESGDIISDLMEDLDRLEAAYPARPDIHSTRGWLFAKLHRPTDARESFQRAHDLKCAEPHVYFHWSELEEGQDEWDEAIRVADNGYTRCSSDVDLLFRRGYCRARRGRMLQDAGNSQAGIKMCEAADEILSEYLAKSDRYHDLRRRMQAHRALTINCDALGRNSALEARLATWRDEYPDDPKLRSEWDRLRHSRPSSIPHWDDWSPSTRRSSL